MPLFVMEKRPYYTVEIRQGQNIFYFTPKIDLRVTLKRASRLKQLTTKEDRTLVKLLDSEENQLSFSV
jgi:hypothetical protein